VLFMEAALFGFGAHAAKPADVAEDFAGVVLGSFFCLGVHGDVELLELFGGNGLAVELGDDLSRFTRINFDQPRTGGHDGLGKNATSQ